MVTSLQRIDEKLKDTGRRTTTSTYQEMPNKVSTRTLEEHPDYSGDRLRQAVCVA